MKKLLLKKFYYDQGQALVELAIITPILIFLLFGVFEVGWALRNYLILTNASREAARFASKPSYLDLEAVNVGFGLVYTHTLYSISGQLPTEDITLIASVIRVDVQQVCNPAMMVVITPTNPEEKPCIVACDCLAVRTDPYSPTIIKHPDMVSYTNYIEKFPATSTHESLIDFDTLSEEIAQNSRQLACDSAVNSCFTKNILPHTVVTAELFLDHHQLFGFPIISNPYTDPLTMYAHTTMRILPTRK